MAQKCGLFSPYRIDFWNDGKATTYDIEKQAQTQTKARNRIPGHSMVKGRNKAQPKAKIEAQAQTVYTYGGMGKVARLIC